MFSQNSGYHPSYDPRDEIIAQNEREIEELNAQFNKVSAELKLELQIYTERATNLQNAMLRKISQLKEQIARKEQLIETVNLPIPKYEKYKYEQNPLNRSENSSQRR